MIEFYEIFNRSSREDRKMNCDQIHYWYEIQCLIVHIIHNMTHNFMMRCSDLTFEEKYRIIKQIKNDFILSFLPYRSDQIR